MNNSISSTYNKSGCVMSDLPHYSNWFHNLLAVSDTDPEINEGGWLT